MAGNHALPFAAGVVVAGVWVVSVDEIMWRASELEAAGGIVPSIALLESAVAKYAVLPMDVVRVRMKLVDMYESYTTNTDLVQDHLARALKAVSANSAVASRKVNSIRVAILLRLIDSQASSAGGFPAALKDADEAIKVSETAKLHELLPRAHMAKAHVLALMGSDIKAHEELGKVHDVASRADTSYNPNCHEEGQGAFNAASTASFLLAAHLDLRGGRLEGAAASLASAKHQLSQSSHFPPDVASCNARGAHTKDAQREPKTSPAPAGGGQGQVTPPTVSGKQSARRGLQEEHVKELAEYYLALSALSAVCAGEIVALPHMVGSLFGISSWLWGPRGAARGSPGSMLRWGSTAVFEGLLSYLRSVAIEAGSSAAAAPKEKSPPKLKLALDETEKGLAGLLREMEAAVESSAAAVFEHGGDAGEAAGGANGVRFYAPGYDDKASSRRVLALLYHRKAELLVARAEFTNALEAIIQMKQALDEIRRGAPPNLHVVCEFASALHCVIAQYCTRLGIYDKALSHLEKAETRTKSEGTRTHALLLRILVLIDSPDTVAQSAMEAEALIEKARGMLDARGGDMGVGARCTLAYLTGKLAVGACREDEEGIAKMHADIEVLDHAVDEAQAASCDKQTLVLLTVLRAEYMYRIAMMSPQISANMMDKSIDCLGKAHVMVTEYGDIWLEAKVLRGLERGYVQVPARARVANASQTIMKSRVKKLTESTAAALGHKLHEACIGWDLGGGSSTND